MKGASTQEHCEDRLARRVVREYASKLGVTLSRRKKDPQPRPGLVFHSTFPYAYDASQRRVVYSPTLDKVATVALLHEVTHCRWPGKLRSPEDEWRAGMIPYELAWARRLLPRTPLGARVLRLFKEYAQDGREGFSPSWRLRVIRVMRRVGLPDPWDGGLTVPREGGATP